MERQWFTYCTSYITPTEKLHYYHVQSLSVYAATADAGHRVAQKRIPPGFKVWTYWQGVPQDPDVSCNMCGAPWHQASGHLDLEQGRVWCGPCTKGMIKFLKGMLVRRWGGVRFYDHALVPPEHPPAGWEP